jgi:hypothetical protein
LHEAQGDIGPGPGLPVTGGRLGPQPQVKLLCVSQQALKGEETVGSCLAKGERFAVVDQYGLVRILTPEEVELTKAFNPKVFETRAFGVKYFREAPAIPPLPVSPEQ